MEEIDRKLLRFECLELEIKYWRGEMINNDNVRRCFVIDDTTAKAIVYRYLFGCTRFRDFDCWNFKQNTGLVERSIMICTVSCKQLYIGGSIVNKKGMKWRNKLSGVEV